MKINIKKLTTTAKIPTRGSEYAAGYDLYADITKTLLVEELEGIPLAWVVRSCDDDRSEERRVGKECRSRWSPYH